MPQSQPIPDTKEGEKKTKRNACKIHIQMCECSTSNNENTKNVEVSEGRDLYEGGPLRNSKKVRFKQRISDNENRSSKIIIT